jgi:YegS/Rv2252/BmrU family lipid kinase
MTAPRRPLIILNPAANRGHTHALLPHIAQHVAAQAVEVLETRAPGDATRLAADAARRGHSPIIAVGGDGTIHEVAAGILDSGCDVALGVVPAGSGNDFATAALHLPPRPEEALAIALGGTARRFDVARLNDGWLLNAFGAGIDANVAWDVRALMRRRTPLRGTALYTLSALRQIAFHYHRLPHLTITVDGELISEGVTMLAAVMVGPSAGGGYRLTPEARPDDGWLDLCISRRMPRPKVLGALVLAKGGRHTGLREVRMLRGRSVQIRSAHAIQTHVDGELQTGRHFDIEIRPAALAIMAPAEGARE